jgi:hypothetical protein
LPGKDRADPVADSGQGARERGRRGAGAGAEGCRDRQGDRGRGRRESRLEGQGEADRTLAIGTPNAQPTKLSVDAYGGPEYRLAEQNFSPFADAMTRINQPLVPQFPMSGAQGQENNGGLIPTAMLNSMFGRMMPDALEKLKQEAPKTSRGNGQV